MAFLTYTDGSANLPNDLQEGIRILPCSYTIDGEACTYTGDLDSFNAGEYYDRLAHGAVIKTALLNTQLFIDTFRPLLAAGKDIIYISMASGISGTFNAAKIAAEELMDEFKERFVHIVDSKTCGLGSGMQAVRSAELSREGVDVHEAAHILDEYAEHCCSYFTVDDLNFLKRTGRVSGATAKIGTLLNIKPILYGTSEAVIVSCGKVRGRLNSIEALVQKYVQKAVEPGLQTVYISHGNCLEDARRLADLVTAAIKPKKLVICPHEPFSGAHVGPGMLALFFYGTER